jgi:uncharacterized Zn finger protein (UPF0148 family)
MEDTIEVCSGCGKMPRALDRMQGQFTCSRCGNKATIFVTAEDYEKVVTELDSKFHMHAQKKRVEAAASAPVEMPKRAARAKKTAAKSKASRTRAPKSRTGRKSRKK